MCIRDSIKSCHAKDIALSEKLTTHLDEVRPGLGGLDYATFLRELDKLDPDTLLMIEHPLCTVPELMTILNERLSSEGSKVAEAELQQALDHLTLCSALDRERQYYAFAAHSFPDVVESSQDVPALLDQLSKQIAASSGGKQDA